MNEILPSRSLQIDSDFMFMMKMEPWPRFFHSQDKLLASEQFTEDQKEKLRKWIEGRPVEECV